MATTLDEVAGFLKAEGLNFEPRPERGEILTGFGTKNYVNIKNNKTVMIVIRLEEDGEFIKCFAPLCYVAKEPKHRDAIFQTLLQISWMTKMLQFEFDPDDGEIRAIIEFPLEDATLTRKQLLRCLFGIAQIIDEHDHYVRAAIEKGTVPESQKELRSAFEEFLKQRRQERKDLGLGE